MMKIRRRLAEQRAEPDLHDPSDSTRGASLSVVMPVHNALPYLDEAIESILGQTYSDFEFVILDDSSTDGSAERLREWAARDSRIRLVRSETKLGPAGSSRRAASEASAELVARMDADDVAHPDRLRRQMEVLAANGDVGLVASLCEVIDSSGRRIRGPDRWRLAAKSPMVPFPHGSIMYRQEAFRIAGGYRDESELWEDQDLVTRMAAISRILVIPDPLLKVRLTPTSTRSLAASERQEHAIDSMYRKLAERDERTRPAGKEKLDPRVFVSLGSVELWAGGRPRLFRRMLSRAELSFNRDSLRAIGWTAWAAASPATLRAFLRLVAAIRNAAARSRLKHDHPVEWVPPLSDAPATSTRKARSGQASA